MKNLLASARSFLFVPGNRPERFETALRSGADAVVLDLEDSVPLGAKSFAREGISKAWAGLQVLEVPLVVRINAPHQPIGLDDLQWLSSLDGLAGVMVPKAESGLALAEVRAVLPGIPILPLIESAAGYANISEIACAAGVLRLVIGHIDFMADTGLLGSEDELELAPLRFAVAMATRLGQLAPAVDGVTVIIADDESLRRDTLRALRFGFGGKLCIHPRQIEVVHRCIAPSADEVAWARRVLEADAASGGAAVQVDGRMIDLPVMLQARRLLARAPAPQ
ncbi:CoA ester lyase [Diaphorobacter sp. HDW4A]|uniref:HpcH/HpaI aldolase/citrate lyase family protein n=1 Tax=Comamonadaceae TaxID=80864 RepID=UPI001409B37E|nr:CoA ester lyase [Diaphorobacter sp. HDW4A]QIL82427.1 CoA ester lyase [Diaphorobacter sp. HDW4A]